MIALDTNVLVRFLTRDDIDQFAAASALMKSFTAEKPGFVGREVLVELVWVLERAYNYPRLDVALALEALLAAIELHVEAADDASRAIVRYRDQGLDFSDLMIVAAGRRVGADTLATFDKKAARIEGATLLSA
jgi:predicted nucleic-acid-binding protein